MFSFNALVKAGLNSYMYQGTCTVYNNEPHEVDGITENNWQKVAGCIPCHLSFKVATASSQSETVSTDKKEAILYLNATETIRKGSKIEVYQHGANYVYFATGEPSIYPNHQEIGLTKAVNV